MSGKTATARKLIQTSLWAERRISALPPCGSGSHLCQRWDNSSMQTRNQDMPGQGSSMVMHRALCLVPPLISPSLQSRGGRQQLPPPYDSRKGFTAPGWRQRSEMLETVKVQRIISTDKYNPELPWFNLCLNRIFAETYSFNVKSGP